MVRSLMEKCSKIEHFLIWVSLTHLPTVVLPQSLYSPAKIISSLQMDSTNGGYISWGSFDGNIGLRVREGQVQARHRGGSWFTLCDTSKGGGWSRSSGVVYLTTQTDNVGIGSITASEKLFVNGNILTNGWMKLGGSSGYPQISYISADNALGIQGYFSVDVMIDYNDDDETASFKVLRDGGNESEATEIFRVGTNDVWVRGGYVFDRGKASLLPDRGGLLFEYANYPDSIVCGDQDLLDFDKFGFTIEAVFVPHQTNVTGQEIVKKGKGAGYKLYVDNDDVMFRLSDGADVFDQAVAVDALSKEKETRVIVVYVPDSAVVC